MVHSVHTHVHVHVHVQVMYLYIHVTYSVTHLKRDTFPHQDHHGFLLCADTTLDSPKVWIPVQHKDNSSYM